MTETKTLGTDEETENGNGSFLLELTTQVRPAAKFTVDGQEYEVLGLDHLSAEQESKAAALFARFGRIQTALEMTGNDTEAESLARSLRAKRIAILTLLTTMPQAVADKLPLQAQVSLMNAIQSEAGMAGGNE